MAITNTWSTADDLVVLDAHQLVTVGEGASGPRRGHEQSTINAVSGGSMRISNGRISRVGTTAEVTEDLDMDTVRVVDARGKVVLPGLIDAHSHPLFAGSRAAEYALRLAGRSRAEIAEQGGGIGATVRQTRETDDATLLAGLQSFLSRLPSQGVTTIEVKSGYGQTTQHELDHLSIIATAAETSPLHVVPTFLGAHIVPEEFDTTAGYTELIIKEMLPAVAEQGIASACDVSCGPGLFTPEQCTEMLRCAAEFGLAGHVHTDSRTSGNGWQTATAIGAQTADHLTFTPASEVDEVGRASTSAVLVPFAELVYLDSDRAPARKFIDNAVPVVVAGDYCSSVYAPPLYSVIPFAAAWYRMTPAEVLAATTINAAYALGLGEETGSLTPGKRADFIVTGLDDYESIAYEFGVDRIEQTYISGELVHSSVSSHV